MRLYLSGPMSGYPQENRPTFATAAAWLRQRGHDVVSPAEIVPTDAGATWEDCLRMDIAALITCEAIVLMRGWPQSKGARLELSEALALGMHVFALIDAAPYHLEDLNRA